jgi:hypothetical protein
VTLVHDPMALVPRRPYGEWIFVRMLVLCSLAALGLVLMLGVVDDSADMDDDAGGTLEYAAYWRVVGLAFLASAIASATFIGASALTDYLDRAIK